MTTADELNMAAVLLTVLGSMMSTFGVLLQMNGYIPSRMVRLISLFWYMFRAALKRGLSGAREYFRGIDILAGEQREDRAVSVFGLILILHRKSRNVRPACHVRNLSNLVLQSAIKHRRNNSPWRQHLSQFPLRIRN